jgi:hypothetical protein
MMCEAPKPDGTVNKNAMRKILIALSLMLFTAATLPARPADDTGPPLMGNHAVMKGKSDDAVTINAISYQAPEKIPIAVSQDQMIIVNNDFTLKPETKGTREYAVRWYALLSGYPSPLIKPANLAPAWVKKSEDVGWNNKKGAKMHDFLFSAFR